jgi:iron complex outermembrane receptor protein
VESAFTLGGIGSPTGVVTDCSGIPFEYTSKWTIDLGARYVMNLPKGLGTATLWSDWNYRTDFYVSAPPIPAAFQTGYGLLNAGLQFTAPNSRYSLEVYGTNVLNRQYKGSVADAGGLTMVQNDGRPAEWGVRVKAKFGQ